FRERAFLVRTRRPLRTGAQGAPRAQRTQRTQRFLARCSSNPSPRLAQHKRSTGRTPMRLKSGYAYPSRGRAQRTGTVITQTTGSSPQYKEAGTDRAEEMEVAQDGCGRGAT